MARPGVFKPVDWDQVDKLCALQCTIEEIADFFKMSVKTFERALRREKNTCFAVYFKAKRQAGHRSARTALFKSMQMGSDRAIIHYHKNYLGHSDKVEVQTVGAAPQLDEKEMEAKFAQMIEDAIRVKEMPVLTISADDIKKKT